LRNSRHVDFAVILSVTSLIAAGCGEGTNDPPDAQPPAPPDAALVVDAAPPDAPVYDIVDAMPGPPVGTCVPSEAIAPPGSGECVSALGHVLFADTHNLGGWYNGRFIAEAACSIINVAPLVGRFQIEMDCEVTAGDPFETHLPTVVEVHSPTRVLPPGLVAGERFTLRMAHLSFDSGSSTNRTWLTMRDEEDGSLLFAVSSAPSLTPEQELLDRLSLTAADWLAPITVETEDGLCPTEVVGDVTLERVAVDVTVPGEGPVRLVDRVTAYLDDGYFVELGSFHQFSDPDWPYDTTLQAMMIVAADRCVQ
jgi:hypothetical protein